MSTDEADDPAYLAVLAALQSIPDLAGRAERVRELQRRDGATFTATVDGRRVEHLLPLDLVPRLVDAASWTHLAAGTEQRARALAAFVADAHGPRTCVRDGVIPAAVVERAAGGAVPDGRHRCATVAGLDLLREADGRWLVLEDNVRVPSGIGYALHARRVIAEALPELAGAGAPADPAGALPLLRDALLAAAPDVAEPRVVLLSLGPSDSASFEHRLLAAELGVELSTPADLTVDGALRVRTADGRPVDVAYRRLDEADLEPWPALRAAVQAGTIVLANGLGCGVADDKAVYAYLPGVTRHLLGEEPLLDGVPTWSPADPRQAAQALPRLAELVAKPVDGYGGAGVTFGSDLDARGLAGLRERITADPAGWVLQEPVAFTTAPVLAGTRFAPRHVDLRVFAVTGTTTTALPSPLTRVAPAGSRIVNSSRGGDAKDTWLLPPPS